MKRETFVLAVSRRRERLAHHSDRTWSGVVELDLRSGIDLASLRRLAILEPQLYIRE
jgi:hypothetical protein